MKIGFVGAGKVGQSFAIYLHHQGCKISGFFSRRLESSQAVAINLNCKAYQTLEDLVRDSDMIGITVNDDQIEPVIEALIQLKLDLSTKYFFHMSGVHNCVKLLTLSHNVFTLHPLKAFPKVDASTERFKTIYFSLEHADDYIKTWLSNLGIKTFEIQSEKKVQYHAAAAILSNYLVSVLDFGLYQLDDIGIDRKMAMDAVWPLIEDTITNVKKLGTKGALTGPIARGDINTIKLHLACMDAKSKTLYKALGNYTLDLANLDESTEKSMRKLFEEVSHE